MLLEILKSLRDQGQPLHVLAGQGQSIKTFANMLDLLNFGIVGNCWIFILHLCGQEGFENDPEACGFVLS